MKRTEINMKELEKYKIIKSLVENNKLDTHNKKRTALKLNCSIRTVNRLINLYLTKGKDGFIHGNAGRMPKIAFSEEFKQNIYNIYLEYGSEANFTHFSEILKNKYNIKVSSVSISKILLDYEILSPKAHKKTKRNFKKQLNEKLETVKTKKEHNQIIDKLDKISFKDAHPRRERSKYIGELVQLDASEYIWFGNHVTHLHLAYDDASKMILGAYFDEQETLNGYYHVFHQILSNYGIPAKFLTDRRMVFTNNKKESLSNNHKDSKTQFEYACHKLGVDIQTTSIPQAKGGIERLNGTLQSRWSVELKHMKVKTIEQANNILKELVSEYNSRFALKLNISQNVFDNQITEEEINTMLAIIHWRKIDSGNCISYNNNFYRPISKDGNVALFRRGTEVCVIQSFNKQMYLMINNVIHLAELIPERQIYSKSFEPDEYEKEKKNIKEKRKWIPPANHPWRMYELTCFKSKNRG